MRAATQIYGLEEFVPGQRMELRVSTEGGVLLLALEGRLTGASDASRLVETVERQVSHEQNTVVIDLEHISWVDSTGVGALVSSFETIRRLGGTVRFCGLNDRLLRIMEITKLDQVLEITATRADAMEAIGADLSEEDDADDGE
ncbi:MAG: STAS domain-containing protein [Candidatus Eisenbacteria bacterium]